MGQSKMPAKVLTEKRVSGIIMSMNNNPSSQALMKQDDPYRQVQSTPHGSGLATPIFVTPSSSELRKGHLSSGANISPNYISKQQWLTIAILTFINLINYMDRYTFAGLIRDVQVYFDINDSLAGSLQTVFVSSYMVVAPIFGYLGDRYSRKWLLALGVAIWVVAVLVGSFMTTFTGFIVMRAIVGVGEASYSTIAPTIISDIFVKDARSKCLAVFYFAIPVGSGLGYVVGQELDHLFGSWQWSMRGTPLLGVVAVFLIVCLLEDPPRGGAEGQDHLKATTYKEDVLSLMTNGSFIFSTIGFTCVTFCAGALSWWGPKFLQSAIYIKELAEEDRPVQPHRVALIFGIMTMVAGIVGVPSGALLSTKLKQKFPRADPTICGVGLALSCVFFGFALFVFCDTVFIFALVLIFLGEISLNLNWSIVADILLYVVTPTRRGTAEALQILASHLFGDAGSPYLIGVVSDSLRNKSVTADEYCSHLKDPDFPLTIGGTNQTRCEATVEYYSMRYALMVNVVIVAVGAVFFFVCALYIVRDKLFVDRFLAASKTGKDDNCEGMLMDLACASVEDPDFTDEDDPPSVFAAPRQTGAGGLMNVKMCGSTGETNQKLESSGEMADAFTRLVDSDSSLDSSYSAPADSRSGGGGQLVQDVVECRSGLGPRRQSMSIKEQHQAV